MSNPSQTVIDDQMARVIDLRDAASIKPDAQATAKYDLIINRLFQADFALNSNPNINKQKEH